MDKTLDIVRGEDDVRLGHLNESLGFLLRLSQLVSFQDFFHNLGDIGVRPGEISVLTVIANNPGVRQGVVARRLMIKRANMTKVIRAMERDGLIRRTIPEDDKRSVQLWLTKKGSDRVASLRAPFLAHEARPARALNKGEEADLKRLLRKYIGLSEPGGGDGS